MAIYIGLQSIENWREKNIQIDINWNFLIGALIKIYANAKSFQFGSSFLKKICSKHWNRQT